MPKAKVTVVEDNQNYGSRFSCPTTPQRTPKAPNTAKNNHNKMVNYGDTMADTSAMITITANHPRPGAVASTLHELRIQSWTPSLAAMLYLTKGKWGSPEQLYDYAGCTSIVAQPKYSTKRRPDIKFVRRQ